jgi:hypothetical protein
VLYRVGGKVLRRPLAPSALALAGDTDGGSYGFWGCERRRIICLRPRNAGGALGRGRRVSLGLLAACPVFSLAWGGDAADGFTGSNPVRALAPLCLVNLPGQVRDARGCDAWPKRRPKRPEAHLAMGLLRWLASCPFGASARSHAAHSLQPRPQSSPQELIGSVHCSPLAAVIPQKG